jgi:hypothetical protein
LKKAASGPPFFFGREGRGVSPERPFHEVTAVWLLRGTYLPSFAEAAHRATVRGRYPPDFAVFFSSVDRNLL